MDDSEFLAQEREARAWLQDLDNFGLPPRVRALSDGVDNPSDGAFSPSPPPASAVGSILDKVKQFQQSSSHPYASKSRVQTSQKMATEGGTRGAASMLAEAHRNSTKPQGLSTAVSNGPQKQRISKQETSEWTEKVRQSCRPVNQWTAANKLSLSNDNKSSSAYSSYSSVGDPSYGAAAVDADEPAVFSAVRAVPSPHSPKPPPPPPAPSIPSPPPLPSHLLLQPAPTARLLVPRADLSSGGALSPRSAACRPVYLPDGGARQAAAADQGQVSRRRPPEARSSSPPGAQLAVGVRAVPCRLTDDAEETSPTVSALSSKSTNDDELCIAYDNFERTLRRSLQDVRPAAAATGRRLNHDIIVDRLPPPDASTSPPSRLLSAPTRAALHPNGTRTRTAAQVGSGSDRLSNGVRAQSSPPRSRSDDGAPPWRRPPSGADALESQQRKFEQLRDQVAAQMQLSDGGESVYGRCDQCGETVEAATDATQALGRLYHSRCFTCCSCGRALRGKRFYEAAGRVYCEEDYHYSGFQQAADRCAACNHLIMDMVLQAVGKSFHPTCFRCGACGECLDGIPFALDQNGRVFCVRDYHRLYAPHCAACRKPILPLSDSDGTVRVVAMNSDYHIDCYVCEGCGAQLTDEAHKRCYPIGDRLLCRSCNVQWSRVGGATAVSPITDL